MLERQPRGLARRRLPANTRGPVRIDAAQIRQLRAELGPAAIAKRLRYRPEFGLPLARIGSWRSGGVSPSGEEATRSMGPSMCYLIMGLLFILAACAPYTYDAGGNPVLYRGSASVTSIRLENCGTPDERKGCPLYRPPRKQSLTPLPDYNDRTY